MDKVWMEYYESIKQEMKIERLCIYPKDIQIATGRSERYGRNLVRKILSNNFFEQHVYSYVSKGRVQPPRFSETSQGRFLNPNNEIYFEVNNL